MADTAPNLDILAPERTLMSGLGARASALPTFATADTDKVLAKATAAKDPSLLPLMERKAQIADATSQALQIENEGKAVLDQAKTKLQRAASQREAQEYNSLVQNFGEVEKTAPELHPTKENMQSLASMFSLIGLIGTAMGKGPGNYSAMNALKSMTGMMQGWQQGDQARWNREVQEYDKAVTEFKTRLDSAQRKYNMGLQKLAIDREAAKADMDMALAELGSPLLKAARDRQSYEAVAKLLNELSKDVDKVYTETGVDRRHQESLALQRGESKPVGTDAKGNVVVMDKQGNLKTLEGVKSASSAKSAGQAGAAVERMTNAMSQAAGAIKNLTDLPVTTTGPMFGQHNFQGLLTAPLGAFNQTLSEESSQMMRTRLTGVGRSLASLETGGAATGLVQLMNKIDEGTAIPPGAKLHVVFDKLAEMRRIVEDAARASLASSKYSEEQKKLINENLAIVREAIPYTQKELDQAIKAGLPSSPNREDKKLTFTQFMQKQHAEEIPNFNSEEEMEAAAIAQRIFPGQKVMVNGVSGTYNPHTE
jgi:hypothetical protein